MKPVLSDTLEFDANERARTTAPRADDGSGILCAPGSSTDPRVCIVARRARGFVARLRGLIGKPLPESGNGLWIEPCAAVHTFGVRAPLDLVFVSPRMVVQRIDANVAPGRMRIAPRCRSVLELRGGDAARLGLRAGMRLEWIDRRSGARP